mgnify:CR=1 FL=1
MDGIETSRHFYDREEKARRYIYFERFSYYFMRVSFISLGLASIWWYWKYIQEEKALADNAKMFINGIKNEEIVEEVYEENDIDVLIKDFNLETFKQ